MRIVSKGSTRLNAFLYVKMEGESASETKYSKIGRRTSPQKDYHLTKSLQTVHLILVILFRRNLPLYPIINANDLLLCPSLSVSLCIWWSHLLSPVAGLLPPAQIRNNAFCLALYLWVPLILIWIRIISLNIINRWGTNSSFICNVHKHCVLKGAG